MDFDLGIIVFFIGVFAGIIISSYGKRINK